MFTIGEAFEQAVRFHKSGNLGQAESLYREIIKANPSHAQATHLLGILARQTGQLQAAEALLKRAIALDPTATAFHFNLGMVQKDLGQLAEATRCFRQEISINFDHVDSHINLGIVLVGQGKVVEAITSYLQALRFNPNNADAHNNLGIARVLQKQHAEALQSFREALRLDPTNPNWHINLGNALKDQGRLAEAVECFQQALRLNPDNANAHNHLGLALLGQGKKVEAIESFRQALRINPNYANGHNNLGTALQDQGQTTEAIASFRQALQIDPKNANAHNNLGSALIEQGKLAEATECYREALRLKPNHADAHNNLGIALVGQGQLAEAALCFEQALTIDPRHRMAPWNRGCLRLLQGDFERGWPDYEQRWAQPGNAPRSFEQPRWDGSNLEGKTILVYAEQGLGDTIQFARYLPLVKERGGTIIFECQPSLLSLMAGSWGRKEGLQPGEKQGRLENGTTVEQVIAAGTALPAFDVHIPLLSLPLLFGTKPDTIPAQVPYLTADAKLVKHWRRDLDLGVSISPMRPIGPIRLIPLSPLSTRHSPLKVGIIWQGSMNQKGDRRSLPLIHFESLARVKGVQLTSLQVGPGTGQIAAATFPITDLGSRFNPDSLGDLAAVMMNLDLVITVDTAGAHLAGALGVPVWTLLQFAPDWRWLLDRSDSPWYPTMRLFRQSRLGDWGEVLERMEKELASLAA